MFGIVLASFQIENKLRQARFFQESFLLAKTMVQVVLGMPFWTFSNADVSFSERELTRNLYTAAKALPTTKRVELIDKKKFVKCFSSDC